MRRAKSFFFIVVFLMPILIAGQNQERKGKGFFAKGKWRIEVQAAWSPATPADLNLAVKNMQSSLEFNNDQRHAFYHQQYGADYVYTSSRDPASRLRELNDVFPFGMTIRRSLGRRVDLALGLSYLHGSAKSRFSARYDIQASPPDGYGTWGWNENASHQIDSDFAVSARAWLPTAGIAWSLPLNRRLAAVAHLEVGPIFTACDFSDIETYKYTLADGFWLKREYDNRMNGKGIGIGIGTGARLSWKLSSRYEFFAGAGYHFRRVVKITGSADFKHRVSDSEMQLPAFSETSYSGTWGIYKADISVDWGTRHYERPDVYYYPENIRNKFHLDLSGFGLYLGFAVRL